MLMVRNLDPSYIPQIKQLWALCFPNDIKFSEVYIDKYMNYNNCISILEDGKIVSMLERLPYTICMGDILVNVTYIYGACTHPDFRRLGMLDELMNLSFKMDIESDISASILIPQYNYLFKLYAKYGFKEAFYVNKFEYSDMTEIGLTYDIRPAEPSDCIKLLDIYNSVNVNSFICRDEDYFKKQLEIFKLTGGVVYCVLASNNIVGYAFTFESEDIIYVQEIVCEDSHINALCEFCSRLCVEKGKILQVITQLNSSFKVRVGMIKYHTNYMHDEITDGYMNLMFN